MQRDMKTDAVEVLDLERHAGVAGNGREVDRGVRRAADRRVDDDGVLERFTGQDLRRLQVFSDHLHDALAGEVGDAPAVPQWRRDGGAAGQAHPERLGQRVHRRRRAHRVAVAGRGGSGGNEVDELRRVDLAGGEELAGCQTVVPDPMRCPSSHPFSIGPPERTMAGMFTVAAAMMQAGVVLSQPVVSTTPSNG